MKTIKYKLRLDDQTETVTIRAENAWSGLDELAALGYDVHYPNWWIVLMEILKRGDER